MFMNIFQGCFKDGTEGTKDCRYFAAVYLIIRVVVYLELGLLGSYQVYATTFTAMFAELLLLCCYPYKTLFFNRLDVIFLLLLTVGNVAESHAEKYDYIIIRKAKSIIGFVMLAIVVVYPVCVLLYIIHKKSRRFRAIVQQTKAILWRQPVKQIQVLSNSEATPLLHTS